MNFDIAEHSHRRYNPLTGEWILVSPHRSKRPWQGKMENVVADNRPAYDKTCYLCPGNERAGGIKNPPYTQTFVFDNDFPALQKDVPEGEINTQELLIAKSERGICRVLCFSPRHDLTLAEMDIKSIEQVINVWIEQYNELAAHPEINYIQIFENKGEIMGCSNPHPHGQIWSESSIPVEIKKEDAQFVQYFKKNNKTLLKDYTDIELEKNERIVLQNDSFVIVVPFWAIWPYETLLIPKREMKNISMLNEKEKKDFAAIVKLLTVKYDNLFNISFPYSAGIHQCPADKNNYNHWHWHMHFYPPLLRSATVKKFMVGYEMLANPQRDITPEFSAKKLVSLPEVHYKQAEKNKK